MPLLSRELAIEVRDEPIIDRLQKFLHHDWEKPRPQDLSDEGLLAELKSSDPNVKEDLAGLNQ